MRPQGGWGPGRAGHFHLTSGQTMCDPFHTRPSRSGVEFCSPIPSSDSREASTGVRVYRGFVCRCQAGAHGSELQAEGGRQAGTSLQLSPSVSPRGHSGFASWAGTSEGFLPAASYVEAPGVSLTWSVARERCQVLCFKITFSLGNW